MIFIAYYILGIEGYFHPLNPDQIFQNNTSTSNLIFDVKMFHRLQKSLYPAPGIIKQSRYWVGRHFPVLYINNSTNLKDNLITNILIRHLHTHHFCFLTCLFIRLPCCTSAGAFPGCTSASFFQKQFPSMEIPFDSEGQTYNYQSRSY